MPTVHLIQHSATTKKQKKNPLSMYTTLELAGITGFVNYSKKVIFAITYATSDALQAALVSTESQMMRSPHICS